MNDDREKEDRYKVSNPGNRNITKLLWKKKVFPIKSIDNAFFG